MPKPEEYKHIAAWGRYLNSARIYIRQQQEQASLDEAPVDAIYKDFKTGAWKTFDDIKSEDTKKLVKSFI